MLTHARIKTSLFGNTVLHTNALQSQEKSITKTREPVTSPKQVSFVIDDLNERLVNLAYIKANNETRTIDLNICLLCTSTVEVDYYNQAVTGVSSSGENHSKLEA